MANFIKNFKKQNYEEGFLPNEVLEELNSKWEGKFKYIYDKNNSYILTPTSEKINFKIENFEIVDIDLIKKKCNKDSLSMEDIFNYSYNAQKPIFLKPKKISNNISITLKLIIKKELFRKMVTLNFNQIKWYYILQKWIIILN